MSSMSSLEATIDHVAKNTANTPTPVVTTSRAQLTPQLGSSQHSNFPSMIPYQYSMGNNTYQNGNNQSQSQLDWWNPPLPPPPPPISSTTAGHNAQISNPMTPAGHVTYNNWTYPTPNYNSYYNYNHYNPSPVAQGPSVSRLPVAQGPSVSRLPVAQGLSVPCLPVAQGPSVPRLPVAQGPSVPPPLVAQGPSVPRHPVTQGSSVSRHPVAQASSQVALEVPPPKTKKATRRGSGRPKKGTSAWDLAQICSSARTNPGLPLPVTSTSLWTPYSLSTIPGSSVSPLSLSPPHQFPSILYKVSPNPPLPPSWEDSNTQALQLLAPYMRIKVNLTSQEYQLIKALIQPRGITVKNIERIINPELMRKFIQTRKELMSSKCEDLELLGGLGLAEDEIIHRAHVNLNHDKSQAVECYPYSDNVALLFHCTRAKVDDLLSQGLDERLGGGGLLGRGIYFADDPMKSTGYDSNATLLIFAVFLGDCLNVDHLSDKGTFVREPQKSKDQKRNHLDQFFDSITGRPASVNEYVIYNRYQCVPVYSVTYSHGNRSTAATSDGFQKARNKTAPFSWTNGHPPKSSIAANWPFFASSLFKMMEEPIVGNSLPEGGNISSASGQHGNISSASGQHGNTSAASGQYGTTSPASSQFGSISSASGQYGNTSAPSAQHGNTSTASGQYGNTSAASGQYGTPSAASSLFGNPSAASGQYGTPSAASSLFGNPSAASGQYGPPSAASIQFGNPSAASGQYGNLAAPAPAGQYGNLAAASGQFLNRSAVSGQYGTFPAVSGQFLNASASSVQTGNAAAASFQKNPLSLLPPPPVLDPEDYEEFEDDMALKLVSLCELGFLDDQLNRRILQSCNGNLEHTIDYLLHETQGNTTNPQLPATLPAPLPATLPATAIAEVNSTTEVNTIPLPPPSVTALRLPPPSVAEMPLPTTSVAELPLPLPSVAESPLHPSLAELPLQPSRTALPLPLPSVAELPLQPSTTAFPLSLPSVAELPLQPSRTALPLPLPSLAELPLQPSRTALPLPLPSLAELPLQPSRTALPLPLPSVAELRLQPSTTAFTLSLSSVAELPLQPSTTAFPLPSVAEFPLQPSRTALPLPLSVAELPLQPSRSALPLPLPSLAELPLQPSRTALPLPLPSVAEFPLQPSRTALPLPLSVAELPLQPSRTALPLPLPSLAELPLQPSRTALPLQPSRSALPLPLPSPAGFSAVSSSVPGQGLKRKRSTETVAVAPPWPPPAQPPAWDQMEMCLSCCLDYANKDFRILSCHHKICNYCFIQIEIERGVTTTKKIQTFIKCPFCSTATGVGTGICSDGTLPRTELRPCVIDLLEDDDSLSLEYSVRGPLEVTQTVDKPNTREEKKIVGPSLS